MNRLTSICQPSGAGSEPLDSTPFPSFRGVSIGNCRSAIALESEAIDASSRSSCHYASRPACRLSQSRAKTQMQLYQIVPPASPREGMLLTAVTRVLNAIDMREGRHCILPNDTDTKDSRLFRYACICDADQAQQ